MKIVKLLHGKILIERKAVEEQTHGGIILPDTAKDKNVGEGTVIQGSDEIPTGSVVLFNKYSGTDVNLEDKKDYVVVDPADVLAIYE